MALPGEDTLMQVEWSEPLPQQDNLGSFSTVMVISQLRHRLHDSSSHAGLSDCIFTFELEYHFSTRKKNIFKPFHLPVPAHKQLPLQPDSELDDGQRG